MSEILRIKKAPKGFLYVHTTKPVAAQVIMDTKSHPNNIDGFKLVRVPSQEEHAELLKKLETRR